MKTENFLLAVLFLLFLNSCKEEKTDLPSSEEKNNLEITIVNPNTGESTSAQGNIDDFSASIEARLEEGDSSAFAAQNPKVFNEKDAKVYFVKYWNTPGYHTDGVWDGIAWDGNAFKGVEKDGYVYYMESYTASSDKFINRGDSLPVMIEKMFEADAVTTDPRQTCWWLATLQGNFGEFTNIDSMLMEATTIRNDEKLQPYLKELQRKVKSLPGKKARNKVVNYTKKTVSGSSSTWNAWEWPGYYNQRKK